AVAIGIAVAVGIAVAIPVAVPVTVAIPVTVPVAVAAIAVAAVAVRGVGRRSGGMAGDDNPEQDQGQPECEHERNAHQSRGVCSSAHVFLRCGRVRARCVADILPSGTGAGGASDGRSVLAEAARWRGQRASAAFYLIGYPPRATPRSRAPHAAPRSARDAL